MNDKEKTMVPKFIIHHSSFIIHHSQFTTNNGPMQQLFPNPEAL